MDDQATTCKSAIFELMDQIIGGSRFADDSSRLSDNLNLFMT